MREGDLVSLATKYGKLFAAFFVIGELVPTRGGGRENDGLNFFPGEARRGGGNGFRNPLAGEGDGGFECAGVVREGFSSYFGVGVGGAADVVDDGLAGLADADDAGGALSELGFEVGEVDVLVVAADDEDGGVWFEGLQGGDGGVGAGGFGVIVKGCRAGRVRRGARCGRIGDGGRGRGRFPWRGGRRFGSGCR